MMKISIDGYHVCNVCRRCYWFSVSRVNGSCHCYKNNAETYPFSSCEYFEYSPQSDAVYSAFDRGKKL